MSWIWRSLTTWWAVTIIPFPLIYKLNVSQAQKYVLAAIFLLPLLPALFGSLKLAFCHPGNQQVDVLKFQVFSSLESSAGESPTMYTAGIMVPDRS